METSLVSTMAFVTHCTMLLSAGTHKPSDTTANKHTCAHYGKQFVQFDLPCTLFRKTAVSVVHEHCPQQTGKLASLMCHRPETANRYYHLIDREKSSVESYGTLNSLMSKVQPDVAVSNGEYDVEINSSTIQPAKEADDMSDIVPPSIPSSNTREKLFTAEEVDIIRRCCKTIIRGGVMSKQSIVGSLELDDDGKEILKQYSMIQLVTRITYERRLFKLNK